MNKVEQTLNSIDRANESVEDAKFSVQNTMFDVNSKIHSLQEQVEPVYMENEYVQEGVLAGALIGGGIIALLGGIIALIKKFSTKAAAGDSSDATKEKAASGDVKSKFAMIGTDENKFNEYYKTIEEALGSDAIKNLEISTSFNADAGKAIIETRNHIYEELNDLINKYNEYSADTSTNDMESGKKLQALSDKAKEILQESKKIDVNSLKNGNSVKADVAAETIKAAFEFKKNFINPKEIDELEKRVKSLKPKNGSNDTNAKGEQAVMDLLKQIQTALGTASTAPINTADEIMTSVANFIISKHSEETKKAEEAKKTEQPEQEAKKTEQPEQEANKTEQPEQEADEQEQERLQKSKDLQDIKKLAADVNYAYDPTYYNYLHFLRSNDDDENFNMVIKSLTASYNLTLDESEKKFIVGLFKLADLNISDYLKKPENSQSKSQKKTEEPKSKYVEAVMDAFGEDEDKATRRITSWEGFDFEDTSWDDFYNVTLKNDKQRDVFVDVWNNYINNDPAKKLTPDKINEMKKSAESTPPITSGLEKYPVYKGTAIKKIIEQYKEDKPRIDKFLNKMIQGFRTNSTPYVEYVNLETEKGISTIRDHILAFIDIFNNNEVFNKSQYASEIKSIVNTWILDANKLPPIYKNSINNVDGNPRDIINELIEAIKSGTVETEHQENPTEQNPSDGKTVEEMQQYLMKTYPNIQGLSSVPESGIRVLYNYAIENKDTSGIEKEINNFLKKYNTTEQPPVQQVQQQNDVDALLAREGLSDLLDGLDQNEISIIREDLNTGGRSLENKLATVKTDDKELLELYCNALSSSSDKSEQVWGKILKNKLNKLNQNSTEQQPENQETQPVQSTEQQPVSPPKKPSDGKTVEEMRKYLKDNYPDIQGLSSASEDNIRAVYNYKIENKYKEIDEEKQKQKDLQDIEELANRVKYSVNAENFLVTLKELRNGNETVINIWVKAYIDAPHDNYKDFLAGLFKLANLNISDYLNKPKNQETPPVQETTPDTPEEKRQKDLQAIKDLSNRVNFPLTDAEAKSYLLTLNQLRDRDQDVIILWCYAYANTPNDEDKEFIAGLFELADLNIDDYLTKSENQETQPVQQTEQQPVNNTTQNVKNMQQTVSEMSDEELEQLKNTIVDSVIQDMGVPFANDYRDELKGDMNNIIDQFKNDSEHWFDNIYLTSDDIINLSSSANGELDSQVVNHCVVRNDNIYSLAKKFIKSFGITLDIPGPEPLDKRLAEIGKPPVQPTEQQNDSNVPPVQSTEQDTPIANISNFPVLIGGPIRNYIEDAEGDKTKIDKYLRDAIKGFTTDSLSKYKEYVNLTNNRDYMINEIRRSILDFIEVFKHSADFNKSQYAPEFKNIVNNWISEVNKLPDEYKNEINNVDGNPRNIINELIEAIKSETVEPEQQQPVTPPVQPTEQQDELDKLLANEGLSDLLDGLDQNEISIIREDLNTGGRSLEHKLGSIKTDDKELLELYYKVFSSNSDKSLQAWGKMMKNKLNKLNQNSTEQQPKNQETPPVQPTEQQNDSNVPPVQQDQQNPSDGKTIDEMTKYLMDTYPNHNGVWMTLLKEKEEGTVKHIYDDVIRANPTAEKMNEYINLLLNESGVPQTYIDEYSKRDRDSIMEEVNKYRELYENNQLSPEQEKDITNRVFAITATHPELFDEIYKILEETGFQQQGDSNVPPVQSTEQQPLVDTSEEGLQSFVAHLKAIIDPNTMATYTLNDDRKMIEDELEKIKYVKQKMNDGSVKLSNKQNNAINLAERKLQEKLDKLQGRFVPKKNKTKSTTKNKSKSTTKSTKKK